MKLALRSLTFAFAILFCTEGWSQASKSMQRRPAQAVAKPTPVNPAATSPSPEAFDGFDAIDKSVAKTTQPINLADALKMALQHNPTLQSARLSWEQAVNTFRAARYNYLFPNFSLSHTDNHTTTSDSDLGTSDYVGSDVTTFGLSGTVPWVGLKYTLNPFTLTNTRDRALGQSYQAGVSSSLTLPLLKGFGPLVSPLVKEQFEITLLMAKLNRDSATVSTINSIRSAYWDLLYANQAMEIQRQSIKAAASLVEETRTKIRRGMLPEIEINNALSHYYSGVADFLRAQQDIMTRQDSFKQLLGLGYQSGAQDQWFQPNDSQVTDLPAPENDVEKVYAAALKNRQDYLLALKNLESSRLSEKLAKNNTLPDISFVAGTNNGAVGLNPSMNVLNAAMAGTRQNNVVGFTLTWNVPNIDNTMAARNASIDTQTKMIALGQLRDSIRNDVAAIVGSLTSSYHRIKAARLAAKLSRAKVDAEMTKYKLGESAHKNVVDFLRDLQSAQLAELESYVSYKKVLIQLDVAMGVSRFE